MSLHLDMYIVEIMSLICIKLHEYFLYDVNLYKVAYVYCRNYVSMSIFVEIP